jgi:hypothetical protein
MICGQRRLLFDFVANDATDDGTANGASRTAAGQYRAADGTDTGPHCGTLALLRHAGASRQTNQQGRCHSP